MKEFKKLAIYLTIKLNAIITALNNKVNVGDDVDNSTHLGGRTEVDIVTDIMTTVDVGTIARDSEVNALIDALTLKKILGQGTVTDGNHIELSDADLIKAVNGNSFVNLRQSNVNGVARIHGDETLYLTTNFRKKILIGANLHSINDTVPTWQGSNSVYQQVQITGVNLRGNISLGSGLNSNTAIIGIGSEYQEIRWGSFILKPFYAPLTAVNFHTNGGSAFSFTDVYSRQMFRIQRVGGGSRTISVPVEYNTTGVNVYAVHNKSKFQLEHRFWSKAAGDLTGQDISKTLELSQERYDSGNGEYKGYGYVGYNSNKNIKLLEDGDVELFDGLVMKDQTGGALHKITINNGQLVVTAL